MSTRTVLGAVGAVIGGYITGWSSTGIQAGWALPAKISGARPARLTADFQADGEKHEFVDRTCDERAGADRG